MVLSRNKVYFAIFFLLFATISVFARPRRKKHRGKQQIQKNIIIDLSGTLFTEDTSSFISKVGFGSITRFALTNWKNPIDSCLDLLEKMSNEKEHKPSCAVLFRGRTMPRCIIEWQQGQKKHNEVQKELDDYIAKLELQGYFGNENEKYVTQTLLNISLNPHELMDITKPVTQMIDLAEQLKKKGYKLYAVSNLPFESYDVLKKTYPDLINLFDGIAISAQVNVVKPNQKIFEHILKTYKLDPKNCVVIDNQKESIPVLEKLGMTAIYYTTPKATKNQLKQLGII